MEISCNVQNLARNCQQHGRLLTKYSCKIRGNENLVSHKIVITTSPKQSSNSYFFGSTSNIETLEQTFNSESKGV